MGRRHRPPPARLLDFMLTWCCCCMLVLRHSGWGGVSAQSSGSDDNDMDGNDDASATQDCDTTLSGMIGDAICDFDLNMAACGFDGGDCCECTCIDTDEQACGEGGAGYLCLDPDAPQDCGQTDFLTGSPAPSVVSSDSSTTFPGCGGYLAHMGDGYCDEDLNNAACGFDGGDCCACTCGGGTSTGTDDLPHLCGRSGDGFNCRDPDVPADCGVTPSPAASYGYPDCTGYMYGWQDSYCDFDLNNAECGYDGGDCCRCTCREYSTWYDTCGLYGFDCMDPEAPSSCSTDSPTPSPAAGTDYPQCEGIIYYIGDGYCDSYNNNEECDWDGGDCCSCTCEDSGYYSPCGYNGYNCLDPSVSTDCSTDVYTSVNDDTTYFYGIYLSDDWTYFDDDSIGPTSCPFSGDAMCDASTNTEECDWDGGDCCECDCVDSFYACGVSGYNCLNPTSACYSTTSTEGDDYDDDDGFADYSDDFLDRDFGDSSTTDLPASKQEAWSGDPSEPALSNAEIGGIFAFSVWGFVMLGCGLWGAFACLTRGCFGETKAGGSTGKTVQHSSAGKLPHRIKSWFKSRERHPQPSGEQLAAAVAAALAIPPEDGNPPRAGTTNAQTSVTARQTARPAVDPSLEDGNREAKVEIGSQFDGYGGGRFTGGGEEEKVHLNEDARGTDDGFVDRAERSHDGVPVSDDAEDVAEGEHDARGSSDAVNGDDLAAYIAGFSSEDSHGLGTVAGVGTVDKAASDDATETVANEDTSGVGVGAKENDEKSAITQA